MQFLNPQVQRDLDAGVPLRLDLGCGEQRKQGFYGIDWVDVPGGVDILADLNEPLELLPSGCAEHVFSTHTLEHVQDLKGLLAEIHRILKPGGLFELIVPHFSNPYYYSDPTHVRFFGLYTMNYFADDPGPVVWGVRPLPGPKFVLESVKFAFWRRNLWARIWVPIFRYFVNRTHGSRDFYERCLCRLFPAWELRFRLRRP